MSCINRQLSDHERRLVRWMLDHGSPQGADFLTQLENAEVTPWTCPCGCASFNFKIRGHPEAPPGVHILADFVFGESDTLSGIFVFESRGTLSGLEVYGLACDPPKTLPQPEELRPVDDSSDAQ